MLIVFDLFVLNHTHSLNNYNREARTGYPDTSDLTNKKKLTFLKRKLFNIRTDNLFQKNVKPNTVFIFL